MIGVPEVSAPDGARLEAETGGPSSRAICRCSSFSRRSISTRLTFGSAGKNLSLNGFPFTASDCLDDIGDPASTSFTRGETGVPAINATESASSISEVMRAMERRDLIFISCVQGEWNEPYDMFVADVSNRWPNDELRADCTTVDYGLPPVC